jgi:adenosylmethionine-8-amino-7-oxononanoate aminotransferase
MNHFERGFESDRRHFLHPFAEFPAFPTSGSRFFDRAEGVHVYGADGTAYLDGIGGLWCVNIGYGRREMAEAIASQVLRLPFYNTFTDMSSAPAAVLAEKLSALAPADLNHVFYTTGGSTAVDSAVRIAHYYFSATGRPRKRIILSRENSYHGSTFLAASITGIKPNHRGFHTLASGPDALVRYVSGPNLYRAAQSTSEAYCDALIDELRAKIEEIGADNIACFFAEPIMGAGGVLVAPEGYHKRALEVCRENDILYVSDEVVTAFGRLGHMFASQDAFNIVPDIIVCAKGITSGYVPLGAALFSDRIFAGISEGKDASGIFSHGFTYSGHPVACAAGLANLQIIENENLCEHVRNEGPYFVSSLSRLMDQRIVGDVRGSHFMMAIEFVVDKATKTNFAKEVGIGKRVAMAAYRRGLIARNVGDHIILSPPLIFQRTHTDLLAGILEESIAEVAAGLKSERGHEYRSA